MIRLHFVVEGHAEENFIRDVLAPELWPLDILTDCHRVTTGRKRHRVFRGGLTSFQQLKNDLLLWMRQDQNPDAYFTTMIDLNGLPDDFPGTAECRALADPVRKVEHLEARLASELVHFRFVPYIQLHEFEALLFADPEKFLFAYPAATDTVVELQVIRSQFQTPEHIDGGTDTAPSKRILQLAPGYDKRVAGPLVVRQIGMATLRRECRHFDAWITKLENCARAQ